MLEIETIKKNGTGIKIPAHMRCACCAPTLISPATLAAVEQERTTLAWFHFRQDDGIRLYRVFSKLRDSGPKTVLSFKAFAHYFHVDPTKVRRARLLLTRRPQRVRYSVHYRRTRPLTLAGLVRVPALISTLASMRQGAPIIDRYSLTHTDRHAPSFPLHRPSQLLPCALMHVHSCHPHMPAHTCPPTHSSRGGVGCSCPERRTPTQ